MASSFPMLVTTAVVSYLLISTVLLGLVAVLDRFPFSDHVREHCWKWAMGLPLIIVVVQMATAVPQFAPRIVMRSPTGLLVAAADQAVSRPDDRDVSVRATPRYDTLRRTANPAGVTSSQSQTVPPESPVQASVAAVGARLRPPNKDVVNSAEVAAVSSVNQRARATASSQTATMLPSDAKPELSRRRVDRKSRLNGWMAASLLLALMSVVGVGVFFGHLLQHRRLVSQCRPLSEGTAHAVLEQLLREQQLLRPVMLKISDTTNEPAACGVRAWTIVLPTDLLDCFSVDEWRVILRHELAHLHRRDPLWLLLGRLVASAFCWQPLNWWALKRWQETAELQCDATVAEAPDRLLLARVLAGLAEWKVRGQIRSGLSLTASPLVRRVRRLLSDPLHAGATRMLSGRKIAAAALIGSLLLAVVSPRVIWAAPPSLTESQQSHAPGARTAAQQTSRGVRATLKDEVRPAAPPVIRQRHSATGESTEEVALAADELTALQVDLSYAVSLIQKSPRYSRLRPQARILKQRLQQLRASLPVE